MVPEEQPKTAPAQFQTDTPAAGPRRRSRRGGRRHSRRRAPRPADAAQPQANTADEQNDPEHPLAETEAAAAVTESQVESSEQSEQKLPPLRPAEVVRAREQPRSHEPRHEPRELPARESQREALPPRETGPKNRSVTAAIEQVNEIIAELRHALEEMDDILETLELAERQKIDDEREIENLQRALRRINRPREDDARHH